MSGPAPAGTPRFRFGIAGWSYPDWEGTVYTRDIKDHLEFVSRFVDLIEINNTFYRPPEARTVASWVRRTSSRAGFAFSVKLHQDITHRGLIEAATARAFHEGLAPMIEAGRLTHLLAQFRYDFADQPDHRALLHRLVEAFQALAEIVIEVRHASWQQSAGLEFLAGLGVTVANLDYPAARDSFTLRECRIGTNGYLRLHGRNRAAWFRKEAGRDETYNYYYSPPEVAAIGERAQALANWFRSLTIVANNHYRGKELANALEIKSLLTGEKVEVPPRLLETYPGLATIARPPIP
jgi:uncharacterized protein YecE (DUF72 family)